MFRSYQLPVNYSCSRKTNYPTLVIKPRLRTLNFISRFQTSMMIVDDGIIDVSVVTDKYMDKLMPKELPYARKVR